MLTGYPMSPTGSKGRGMAFVVKSADITALHKDRLITNSVSLAIVNKTHVQFQ